MARSALEEMIAQLRHMRFPQREPPPEGTPLCGMCRCVAADEADPFGVPDPLDLAADPGCTDRRLFLLWSARAFARAAIVAIEQQQIALACTRLREAAEILERAAARRLKAEAA